MLRKAIVDTKSGDPKRGGSAAASDGGVNRQKS
jgi:hypothetical protein